MSAILWTIALVAVAVGAYALGWRDRGLYEEEKRLAARLDFINRKWAEWNARRLAREATK